MADNYFSTGASSLGVNGLKALVTLFSQTAIAAKKHRNLIFQNTKNDISGEIGTIGQSIVVPLYTKTTPTNLTDGQPSTKNDTLGAGKTVTLNTHDVEAWGFTDVGKALAGQNPEVGVMKQRVAGMISNMNSNLGATASTAFTTNVVGAYSTQIDLAQVNACTQKLYENEVPQGEDLFGYLHPTAWSKLISLDNVVRASYRGTINPLVTENPDVLSYNGVKWAMTQGIAVNNTTEVSNFVMHPHALLFAMRGLPIAPPGAGVVQEIIYVDGFPIRLSINYDANYLSMRWTADCIYGSAVGEQLFGVELRSDTVA